MIQQHSAGILVYTQDKGHRKYLLLQYVGGHWDFAKGKLEKDETTKQAAIRELKEETGLEVELIPGFEEALSYTFKERGNFIHKTVVLFVGHTHSQEVTLSREHQQHAWLPFQQAYQQLTYKNAREILAQAENFLRKSESEK